MARSDPNQGMEPNQSNPNRVRFVQFCSNRLGSGFKNLEPIKFGSDYFPHISIFCYVNYYLSFEVESSDY